MVYKIQRILLFLILGVLLINCGGGTYKSVLKSNEFPQPPLQELTLISYDVGINRVKVLQQGFGEKIRQKNISLINDSLSHYFSYGGIQLNNLSKSLDEEEWKSITVEFNRISESIEKQRSLQETSNPLEKINVDLDELIGGSPTKYGIYLRFYDIATRYSTGYGGSYVETSHYMEAYLIDIQNNEVDLFMSKKLIVDKEEIVIEEMVKSLVYYLSYGKNLKPEDFRIKIPEGLVRIEFNNSNTSNLIATLKSVNGFELLIEDRLGNEQRMHLKDVKKISSMRDSRTIFSAG